MTTKPCASGASDTLRYTGEAAPEAHGPPFSIHRHEVNATEKKNQFQCYVVEILEKSVSKS